MSEFKVSILKIKTVGVKTVGDTITVEVKNVGVKSAGIKTVRVNGVGPQHCEVPRLKTTFVLFQDDVFDNCLEILLRSTIKKLKRPRVLSFKIYFFNDL